MTQPPRALRSSLVIAATLCGSLFSGAANAEPCSFTRFSPGAFHAFILDSLPGLGLTVVPPGFTILGEDDLTAGLSGDLTFIARGGEVVAVIAYNEDVLTQQQRLVVVTAGGDFVLGVVQGRVACGPATCYRTVYDTAWDLAGGPPPFVVDWGPFDGTDYSLFGVPVGSTYFRAEFEQSIDWLMEVLSSLPGVYPVRFDSPVDELEYLVASDPWLAPHAYRLTFTGAWPNVLITGRVPSNWAYGQVIDYAFSLGFWGVNPDIIIDTRLQDDGLRPLPAYLCVSTYPVYSWPTTSWWPSWPAWYGWSWWAGWPWWWYLP